VHSSRFSFVAALTLGMAQLAFCGTPEADWAQVTALDAGPQVKMTSQSEARQIAMNHLGQQEKALRAFLSEHETAPQAFEARLRLSRALQIRADFEKNDRLRAEASKYLDQADKVATPEQRVEVDFARVAFVMRRQRAAAAIEQKQLLDAVRGFQAKYPDDRRLGALLAEVATLFDAQPRTKRALLTDAQTITTDEGLKARIADDLKRLDLLGASVPLSFTSVQGQAVNLETQKGRVTVLVFFADWSPPSVAAIGNIKQAVSQLPAGKVQVVGLCLDQDPQTALRVLKEQGVNWPVACDGKGWNSPLVRNLGVNTLPTVWLIDPQGRLRALNALNSIAAQTRQILAEK
jgi:cytochrome oxidase Cu insertion factor (SCO1/SenC/PrrC family)